MVDTGGRAAGRAAQAAKAFAGGQSGGGGGGANWMPEPVEKVTSVREASSAASKAGDGWGFSIDLDDGFIFIVIAILAALGGVLCVGYVIYIAPMLLAEVALDAALVSAAYRRLRKEDVVPLDRHGLAPHVGPCHDPRDLHVRDRLRRAALRARSAFDRRRGARARVITGRIR